MKSFNKLQQLEKIEKFEVGEIQDLNVNQEKGNLENSKDTPPCY